MRKLLLLCLFAVLGIAQNVNNPGTTARRIVSAASLPATCNVGDVYFKTAATVGSYQCLTTNNWTEIGGGGGGSCDSLAGNVTGTCGTTVVGGVRTGLISGLPATCTVGDIYFATDAAGANIYQCAATNTWSAPGGATSGSYSQSFTSQTSVTLTHNLGTVAVEVQCFDGGSPPQKIETNTEQATTTNSYTVTFTSAQTGSCVVLSGSGAAGPVGPQGPSGGSDPGSLSNQPLTGLGVEYVSGLTFTVGAGTYLIGGTPYSSPLTSVTLAAADPSNPRIDVIYVDNTDTVNKLTGTPAASPAQPTVDYSTQLPLNLILVAAGATTPTGIASTLIYDENVEWTCTASAHFNCASTNNPYHGTKDIEATTAVAGNNVTLVKPTSGTVDLSTQNNLVCYVRSKAKWPTGSGSGSNGLRTFSFYWLNGSTQVGNQVVLRDAAFGFSSSNTTAYQQINIPIGLFATGANLVTTLEGKVTGNGGTSSIGFYLDQCSLQSGTGTLTLPASVMNFKGTWNSTANYNVNDTVVSSSVGYVALAANTNVAVSTSSTWARVSPATTTCTAPQFLITSVACATPVLTQNSQSAAYTTVLGDAGKMILHPASDNNARTFTIDSNANVAYPTGTCITFVNMINTVTIAITSDTMTLMGANTTGTRTLAVGNWATVCKIASTSWVIGGSSGLT